MTDKCNITTDRRLSHTPGPWSVYERNPLCIESLHGNIGLVNLARASEADARLIAAAPDLLAALKRLLATQYPGTENHHETGCRCVIHEAQVAIAKAEGQL